MITGWNLSVNVKYVYEYVIGFRELEGHIYQCKHPFLYMDGHVKVDLSATL